MIKKYYKYYKYYRCYNNINKYYIIIIHIFLKCIEDIMEEV